MPWDYHQNHAVAGPSGASPLVVGSRAGRKRPRPAEIPAAAPVTAIVPYVPPLPKRPRRVPAAPNMVGRVLVEADEGDLPFDARCSDYVLGCRVESQHGRHAGLCSHVLLDTPRGAGVRRR